MLNFVDFEVFRYNWLMVGINPMTDEEVVIIDDKNKLEEYYNKHKNEIFVTYNGRNYDQYILKGILCDFNPYEINNHIIVEKRSGYTFSSLLNKIPLNNYDVGTMMYSLKQLEGFMGNDIRETSVPFNIDRPLTEAEIEETVKYCRHDVMQTIEVFMKKKSDFDAQMDLIKTFKLPLSYIGKTKAQITALALGCQRKKFDDEWEISFVPTIKLDKYKHIWDWFKEASNYKEGQKLEEIVCGIPHTFGLGGIHGAPDKPIHKKGLIIHVDVTSYYPSLMIEYDLLSRTVKDKKVYKEIYDKRVDLKRRGLKKEQAPYKIILNGTFGITNDQYSLAYDPRRNHEVTINGQLLLLDLLEKLENYCEIIQSNTDGLIIQIPDTDEAFEKIDDICYEWEKRTGMKLGFDMVSEIWQKDVNNYIFKYENGKLERKGAYVKELSTLDNDLPIINKALVDYMTKNIPVEETINNCQLLMMFQKIVKVSGKYLCAWHNGQKLTDKTFRVFASLNIRDTYIGKQKSEGTTIEKFASTPDHCKIVNEDIHEMIVPEWLDKTWYISLSRERLKQFGVIE